MYILIRELKTDNVIIGFTVKNDIRNMEVNTTADHISITIALMITDKYTRDFLYNIYENITVYDYELIDDNEDQTCLHMIARIHHMITVKENEVILILHSGGYSLKEGSEYTLEQLNDFVNRDVCNYIPGLPNIYRNDIKELWNKW